MSAKTLEEWRKLLTVGTKVRLPDNPPSKKVPHPIGSAEWMERNWNSKLDLEVIWTPHLCEGKYDDGVPTISVMLNTQAAGAPANYSYPVNWLTILPKKVEVKEVKIREVVPAAKTTAAPTPAPTITEVAKPPPSSKPMTFGQAAGFSALALLGAATVNKLKNSLTKTQAVKLEQVREEADEIKR